MKAGHHQVEALGEDLPHRVNWRAAPVVHGVGQRVDEIISNPARQHCGNARIAG